MKQVHTGGQGMETQLGNAVVGKTKQTLFRLLTEIQLQIWFCI